MDEAIQQRIDALKSKLEARKGKPGFEANVRAIEQELAELRNGVKSQ